MPAPGLAEELWKFAKSAYLDSPLPSLFKERLFVHLSRFCEVRLLNRRVLVVDDNQDAANATAMLIAEMGGDARVAYSGESALAMPQECQPEVILLDIGMRGLDGYETCHRMRRVLGNGVLLVALTGFGQEQDKEKATRAGFDAHLTKPADEAALTGILSYRVFSGSYEKESGPQSGG